VWHETHLTLTVGWRLRCERIGGQLRRRVVQERLGLGLEGVQFFGPSGRSEPGLEGGNELALFDLANPEHEHPEELVARSVDLWDGCQLPGWLSIRRCLTRSPSKACPVPVLNPRSFKISAI
jgi:hypothetical protein